MPRGKKEENDLELEFRRVCDDENAAGVPRRRKPYRYRWPDDFRDEVLARLLELNERRHKEEQLAGAATSEKSASKEKSTQRKPSKTPLFDQD